jgi:hypothetical protein
LREDKAAEDVVRAMSPGPAILPPRRFLPALFLLTVGCGGRPSSNTVRYVDFAINEQYQPTPFEGGHSIIDGVEMHTTHQAIIGDVKSGNAPDGFDAVVSLVRKDSAGNAVPLTPGRVIEVERGESAEVWAMLAWQLPDDPPPMLALITATFRLKLGDRIMLEKPPQSFVLESREGVLDTVIEGVSHNLEQSAGVLKEVEGLKGTPSEGVKKLRKALAVSPLTN